jgi:hypothetical protein
MSRISSDAILDKLQNRLNRPGLPMVPCILAPLKVHHALFDSGASMITLLNMVYDCLGMYKLKEAIEKFCSDLLASHRRKCDCALAGMTTWRFFSCRKVMKSLLVGIGYKPL